MSNKRYVIGIDFGTDSCRAAVINAENGAFVSNSTCVYPRWKEGRYCNPERSIYRQHPQDYIDALIKAVGEAVRLAGKDVSCCVRGIGVDTTASTPVLLDSKGIPLAMTPEFSEDSDAMFILWKDHSADAEADEITKLAHKWNVDYTSYSGGAYSAEWAWSKVLHVLRTNSRVAQKASSWIEHCDWIVSWLTGAAEPAKVLHSRCAAGHKAMWNQDWQGLPSEDFLSSLDPRLALFRRNMYENTFTSDVCAGIHSKELAVILGLPYDVKIAVGSVDAHVGAVGASVAEGVLTRIMGTSTCDILVKSYSDTGERRLNGICGQVEGSVIPGMIGYEAGQAAFGDVFSWFRRLLMWPLTLLDKSPGETLEGIIFPELEKAAVQIDPAASSLLALDWINGRRTPDPDQYVCGALTGITLGTSAPMLYRSLIEATAFGTRAIIDRFETEGVYIGSVRAVGGVARKSPLVMQIMSDVIGRKVSVVDCDQACALGSGMFAAVASGLYPTIPDAQKAMQSPVGTIYIPDMKTHSLYEKKYARYQGLGAFVQSFRIPPSK